MLFGDPAPLQAWRRLYGGSDDDRGYDVQETSDKGYIIVGYTSSFGAGLKDVYLIKTDIDGDTLWTKTYGGTGDDIGYSVQQTDDLGYIIAGHTNSFGGLNEVYIIKTDSDGNVVWTKLCGGAGDDMGFAIQKTVDLGYIIAGYTDSYGAGLTDVYLIKTDANGDTLWTRTYGGTGLDVGMSVEQTADSGYIIAGSTGSFGAGGTDMYLIKTDVDGDTLWTKTYGILHNEVAHSVQQTADLGYIVTGYMQKIGGEDSDLYLLKTDGNGEEDWSFLETSEDYIYGYSVYQTSDEGYIVGGYSNATGGEDGDLYLLRTNSIGDTLWKDKPDTFFTRRIHSVQQTSEGYYIVCGYSNNPKGHGGNDVWLAKYKYEIVGIEEERHCQKHFSIHHETSNPFTDKTVIRYELPKANYVDVVVYNHLGQAVRNLILNMSQQAGTHTVVWDGTDNSGRNVSTGVYFLKINAGEVSETSKLVKLE